MKQKRVNIKRKVRRKEEKVKLYQWLMLVAIYTWLCSMVFVPQHQVSASSFVVVDKVDAEYAPHLTTENMPQTKVEKVPNFNVNFPSLNYKEKAKILKSWLRFNGVSNKESDILVEIATLESCRSRDNGEGCMNPRKTPPVVVKHCESKASKRWYVVEVSNTGGQAQCNRGDLEGRNEQSFGLFQILESTWDGHKCQGDRFDWKNQAACAVKIKNQSGLKSWSTYQLVNI